MKANSEGLVEDVTGLALSASDEMSRVVPLTCLHGVGWPTASVILHFFHGDPYPILDFRALYTLGLDAPPDYTFGFWTEYVTVTRELAGLSGLSMRELDKALWQYSKEEQSPGSA